MRCNERLTKNHYSFFEEFNKYDWMWALQPEAPGELWIMALQYPAADPAFAIANMADFFRIEMELYS